MNPLLPISSILIVDEDASLQDIVGGYLTRQGYHVSTAGTTEEALDVLSRGSVPCMLLAVDLAGQSGIELIADVHRVDPDIAIIMMSGPADPVTTAACHRAGAADVVVKPFDLAGLAGIIGQALHDRQDLSEERRTRQWIREDLEERDEHVRQAQAKLERVSAASLDALVLALESKDPYMAGHSIRVAHVAASIAAEMGRSDEDVEVMRLAGRLHDIGVVGISDGILAKQAALTPAEFAEVKRHVTIGAQILAPYTHLGEVAEFVRGHHERWDGTGYPDGLSGEHIPWGARILAAAEIHDAITSARPYRERIPLEEAILQMASMSGTTLEPAVYRALANVVDRGQALDFLTEAHGGESETQMSLAAAAS